MYEYSTVLSLGQAIARQASLVYPVNINDILLTFVCMFAKRVELVMNLDKLVGGVGGGLDFHCWKGIQK
jgi:hypothetical protein